MRLVCDSWPASRLLDEPKRVNGTILVLGAFVGTFTLGNSIRDDDDNDEESIDEADTDPSVRLVGVGC